MRKSIFVCVILICVALAVYAQSSSTNRDGLSMSLGVEHEQLESGEPLDISLRLMNHAQKELIYEFVNMNIYEFWITDTAGQEVWRYSDKAMWGKQVLRLKRRESKVYRTTWNQTDKRGKAVEPGWYMVYAKFTLADRNETPMQAKINIGKKSTSQESTVIFVPVRSGTVNASTDIGKNISVEGTLRQSPQGLYIDARSVKIDRQGR